MKRKLKATITFEYEIDDEWYQDDKSIENIIKQELQSSEDDYFAWLDSEKTSMDTVIEPSESTQQ